MAGNRDPVGSVSEDMELLERHISILKTVKGNQPVGLITPDGATVSDKYDGFMREIADYIDELSVKVEELRGLL